MDSTIEKSPIPYFIIGFIYVLSFLSIYYHKTVLLGVLVLYLINVIASIFISKDMFASPKVNDPATILLFIPMILNIVSSTMIMITLKSLHAKYTKKDEKIKMSEHYSQIISKYVTMFIATIVFIGVLVGFYFTDPIDRPYFDYQFTGMGANPKWLLFKFLLKILLVPTTIGLSGYMVFGAHQFIQLRN